MRITERQLRRIIREELDRAEEELNEIEGDDYDPRDDPSRPWHHADFDANLARQQRDRAARTPSPAPTPAYSPNDPRNPSNWGPDDRDDWGPYHHYGGGQR